MAVVQAVLLFGSETWVLTPRLERSLKGFRHQVARQMAVMVPNDNRVRHGCTHPLGR